MNAKKKLKKYLTKGLRRIRYRKGFGVHSPFVYSLITQVIGEHTPFYGYEEIRRLRRAYMPKRTFVPGRIYRVSPSLKYLFLAYRLINRFGCSEILEINNNGGLATMALSLPSKQCHVVSLGAGHRNMEQARRIAEAEKAENVTLEEGNLLELIARLPAEYRADFVLVNKQFGIHDVDMMFDLLRNHLHDHSILLLEKIHSDPEMRKLWGRFRSLPEVRTTVDLYELGLVIFDDKRYKQHFIVSF